MQIPRISVLINSHDISSFVSWFELESSLLGDMDSMKLEIADIVDGLAGSIKRGDILQVSWGYSGEYNLLFEGLITKALQSEMEVTVTAVDYSVLLNGIMISETYLEESASEILKRVMGVADLELEIEDSGFVYPVFPVLNESARSVLQKITKDVSQNSKTQYFHSVKAKSFSWKALDESQPAVLELTTGENIIKWKEGQEVTTLIVPVRCGEVVEIDGGQHIVWSALYRWDNGGRVILRVKPL